MKLLSSIIVATASGAYFGDGTCSTSFFNRESCTGNRRDDACCTEEQLCTLFGILDDFSEQYPAIDCGFAPVTTEDPVTVTGENGPIIETTTPEDDFTTPTFDKTTAADFTTSDFATSDFTTSDFTTSDFTTSDSTTSDFTTQDMSTTMDSVSTDMPTRPNMSTTMDSRSTTSGLSTRPDMTPTRPTTMPTTDPEFSTEWSTYWSTFSTTSGTRTTGRPTRPDTDETRPTMRPTEGNIMTQEDHERLFALMFDQLKNFDAKNVNFNFAPKNTNMQNFVDVETNIHTNINVNMGGAKNKKDHKEGTQKFDGFNRDQLISMVAEEFGCPESYIAYAVFQFEKFMRDL